MICHVTVAALLRSLKECCGVPANPVPREQGSSGLATTSRPRLKLLRISRCPRRNSSGYAGLEPEPSDVPRLICGNAKRVRRHISGVNRATTSTMMQSHAVLLVERIRERGYQNGRPLHRAAARDFSIR